MGEAVNLEKIMHDVFVLASLNPILQKSDIFKIDLHEFVSLGRVKYSVDANWDLYIAALNEALVQDLNFEDNDAYNVFLETSKKRIGELCFNSEDKLIPTFIGKYETILNDAKKTFAYDA